VAAVVPSHAAAGEVLAQLQRLLAENEVDILADPENEALLGQRTFFEKQVARTQNNANFVDALRPRVAAGEVPYLQRVVLTVDKALFDDEIYFWKNAMGMRVTREVNADAALGTGSGKSVIFAFGQETLGADDGGKAAVEIREGPEGTRSVGNGLSYISLSVPYGIRVSRIYEAGGELVYGFGYFDVRAPSGYMVRAQVAKRRDPVELVAINVPSVKVAVKYYSETFGMTAQKPQDNNGYAPRSPPGSRLMTFGDPDATMGILLQPIAFADRLSAKTKLEVGEVFQGVVFVSSIGDPTYKESKRVDPSGFAVEVEGYEAWEAGITSGADTLPPKYNLPPPSVQD